MTSEETTSPPQPEKLSYEQAVEELEAIIDRIEQGEIGLERSLLEYRRGTALIRRCRALLDAAEVQVREITEEQLAEED